MKALRINSRAAIHVRGAILRDAEAISGIANESLVDPTISWRDMALTLDEVWDWIAPSSDQKHIVLDAERSGLVLGFFNLGRFQGGA